MTDRMAVALASARKHWPTVAAVSFGISVALFSAARVFRVLLDLQPYLSAGLGLMIVCYILHRLLCCSAQYNSVEKFGMAMTAAGMVMATPALWMPNTPFDGWSFNVARFGIAVYIVTGGLRRDRHRSRNLAQAAYWEGFQDGREKGPKA